MVHELNVPYIIPDLPLPPVGSAPSAAQTAAPSYLPLLAAAATIIAVLVLGAFAHRFKARP
jgi:hypothetical protein